MTSPTAFPLADPDLADRLTARLALVEERLRDAVDARRPAGRRRRRGTSSTRAASGCARCSPCSRPSWATGQRREVVDAAVVVELTHLATLYHDDVMDSAPAAPRGAGGARGVGQLGRDPHRRPAVRAGVGASSPGLGPDAVRIQAATFERLCLGQLHETVGPRPERRPRRALPAGARGQDGLAHRDVGPVRRDVRGLPARRRGRRSRGYGEKIGVAFQLADDVIDLTSDGDVDRQDARAPTCASGCRRCRRCCCAPAPPARTAPRTDRDLVALLDGDLSGDADLAEAVAALRVHPVVERDARRARSRWRRRPSASSTRCRPVRSRTRSSRSPTRWWTARPEVLAEPDLAAWRRGPAPGPQPEDRREHAPRTEPDLVPLPRTGRRTGPRRTRVPPRRRRSRHAGIGRPRRARGCWRTPLDVARRAGRGRARVRGRRRRRVGARSVLLPGPRAAVAVGQWVAEARTGATVGNAVMGIRTLVGRHGPARGPAGDPGARSWSSRLGALVLRGRPVGRRRLRRLGPQPGAARLARQGGRHAGAARTRRAPHGRPGEHDGGVEHRGRRARSGTAAVVPTTGPGAQLRRRPARARRPSRVRRRRPPTGRSSRGCPASTPPAAGRAGGVAAHRRAGRAGRRRRPRPPVGARPPPGPRARPHRLAPGASRGPGPGRARASRGRTGRPAPADPGLDDPEPAPGRAPAVRHGRGGRRRPGTGSSAAARPRSTGSPTWWRSTTRTGRSPRSTWRSASSPTVGGCGSWTAGSTNGTVLVRPGRRERRAAPGHARGRRARVDRPVRSAERAGRGRSDRQRSLRPTRSMAAVTTPTPLQRRRVRGWRHDDRRPGGPGRGGRHGSGQRSRNEDSVWAADGVYLVADGMGGHEAGEVASRTAIEVLRGLAVGTPGPDDVRRTVRRAHSAVRDLPATTGRRPGTTATGVVLTEHGDTPCWLVVNVGDSRTYRMAGGVLEQVTRRPLGGRGAGGQRGRPGRRGEHGTRAGTW